MDQRLRQLLGSLPIYSVLLTGDWLAKLNRLVCGGLSRVHDRELKLERIALAAGVIS